MGRGDARKCSPEYPSGCFGRSGLCVDDNAMPVEGVEKLCGFIRAFDKNN